MRASLPDKAPYIIIVFFLLWPTNAVGVKNFFQASFLGHDQIRNGYSRKEKKGMESALFIFGIPARIVRNESKKGEHDTITTESVVWKNVKERSRAVNTEHSPVRFLRKLYFWCVLKNGGKNSRKS